MFVRSVSHGSPRGGGEWGCFGVVLWLVFGVLGGCFAFSVGLSVFWCGCGFVLLGFE